MKANYFIVLLFCFSSHQLFSQAEDITFRQISPPGGFSFQAVHTITQDLFGYIWMGTYDGILKYDSKEVKRFIYNQEEEINGLPSNGVTGIAVDSKNNVWVGTDAGLCLFNRKLQQFEPVVYTYENGDAPGNSISSIALDGNGNLWITDENFFGYLNKEKNQLVRFTEGLKQNPVFLYNDERRLF